MIHTKKSLTITKSIPVSNLFIQLQSRGEICSICNKLVKYHFKRHNINSNYFLIKYFICMNWEAEYLLIYVLQIRFNQLANLINNSLKSETSTRQPYKNTSAVFCMLVNVLGKTITFTFYIFSDMRTDFLLGFFITTVSSFFMTELVGFLRTQIIHEFLQNTLSKVML